MANLLPQLLDGGIEVFSLLTWLSDAARDVELDGSKSSGKISGPVPAEICTTAPSGRLEFVICCLNFLRQEASHILFARERAAMVSPQRQDISDAQAVSLPESQSHLRPRIVGGRQSATRGRATAYGGRGAVAQPKHHPPPAPNLESVTDFPALGAQPARPPPQAKRRITPLIVEPSQRPADGDITAVESQASGASVSAAWARSAPPAQPVAPPTIMAGRRISHRSQRGDGGPGGNPNHFRDAAMGQQGPPRAAPRRSLESIMASAADTDGEQLAATHWPAQGEHPSGPGVPPEPEPPPVQKRRAVPELVASSNGSVEARTPDRPPGPPSQVGKHPPPLQATPQTARSQAPRRSHRGPQLQPFATLYAHLILLRLVPSLATELQLVVGLLCVAEDQPLPLQPPAPGMSGPGRFFQDASDCRLFAVLVLSDLKPLLRHLGQDLLSLLGESRAVNLECPSLALELQGLLQEVRGGAGDRGVAAQEEVSLVSGVGAPNASLQWGEEDSRRNVHSAADGHLLNNRQKCLDMFASAMRQFQVEKRSWRAPISAIASLRGLAMDLMREVHPVNMAWLAQYFKRQLVGFGLSAVEELDDEVIARAGNAQRLEQLGRRITQQDGEPPGGPLVRRVPQQLSLGSATGPNMPDSPAGQEDRGRPIGTPTAADSHSSPQRPLRQPHHPGQAVEAAVAQQFPGNQEFFFRFIVLVDSHLFYICLQTALAAEIDLLYRGCRAEGFADTLAKLKVLAKFLGLLTFWPNWRRFPANAPDNSAQPTDVAPTSLRAAALQAESLQPSFPVLRYLQDAWARRCLVSVVPWVAAFLGPIKWDALSREVSHYKQVLSALADVHSSRRLIPPSQGPPPALLLVRCEIEGLYEDLGLQASLVGREVSRDCVLDLPAGLQPPVEALDADPLDQTVVLSRRLVRNCCPYLEGVLVMLRRAQDRPHGALAASPSPSAPAKRTITPYSLAPLQSGSGSQVSAFKLLSAAGSANAGQDPSQPPRHIRVALVETFFHMHPGLKELAHRVINTVVPNACEEALQDAVERAAREALTAATAQLDAVAITVPEDGAPHTPSEGWTSEGLRAKVAAAARLQAEPLALAAVAVYCGSRIPQAIMLLAPTKTDRRVKEVACGVAVGLAVTEARSRVVGALDATVAAKSREVVQTWVRQQKAAGTREPTLSVPEVDLERDLEADPEPAEPELDV